MIQGVDRCFSSSTFSLRQVSFDGEFLQGAKLLRSVRSCGDSFHILRDFRVLLGVSTELESGREENDRESKKMKRRE